MSQIPGKLLPVSAYILPDVKVSPCFPSIFPQFELLILLRIQNDLLHAADRHCVSCLVLLDLSAAFDTVDHSILLRRLSSEIGLRGVALDWFASYLTTRSQSVKVSGVMSQALTLHCGVPQGSVLGPTLFTLYTASETGQIIRQHDLDFYLYADDSQLKISFCIPDSLASIH